MPHCIPQQEQKDHRTMGQNSRTPIRGENNKNGLTFLQQLEQVDQSEDVCFTELQQLQKESPEMVLRGNIDADLRCLMWLPKYTLDWICDIDKIGKKKDVSTKRPIQNLPYSYNEILKMAFEEQGPLTVEEIYQWIMKKFPCFPDKDYSWKNSIRQKLSTNIWFVKSDKTGKKHEWRYDRKKEEYAKEQPSKSLEYIKLHWKKKKLQLMAKRKQTKVKNTAVVTTATTISPAVPVHPWQTIQSVPTFYPWVTSMIAQAPTAPASEFSSSFLELISPTLEYSRMEQSPFSNLPSTPLAKMTPYRWPESGKTIRGLLNPISHDDILSECGLLDMQPNTSTIHSIPSPAFNIPVSIAEAGQGLFDEIG
ncbi:forkhead box protein Q1 [Lingula anatina]|uniref:Forkhead box protein Q1 n=1 Tax=Lingula anatina TaxID=7574 RepID=A0A1S3IGM4_LINAN|nr:forkhead box protein Q1 [Lingula anatina]|eukprot:XP_013397016.1 forkhead box protein Q1 [Lingula anatina]